MVHSRCQVPSSPIIRAGLMWSNRMRWPMRRSAASTIAVAHFRQKSSLSGRVGPQLRAHDQSFKIVLALLLDKSDGKPGLRDPHHAADADPDRKRHPERWLHLGRHSAAGGRHVDDEAWMEASIRQRQGRMRRQRNDAQLPSLLENGRILLPLLKPG